MNTSMNGRKIRDFYFVTGEKSGESKWCMSVPGEQWELSATFHGDRDEFWLICRNAEGAEIARYNARYAAQIHWLEPISHAA